eukprot:CAMPEP_0172047106 /NCGR_PEP_ID=MMETSP1043-20130122/811_1 /TAXON_ID=464988 /ORGANISM="Hemiselmis andersenii, Strain CCMP441" /LENGTH=42 /DNA_ID= /DNA_START= /DNA_END= /DNA_ORIENTATION=
MRRAATLTHQRKTINPLTPVDVLDILPFPSPALAVSADLRGS